MSKGGDKKPVDKPYPSYDLGADGLEDHAPPELATGRPLGLGCAHKFTVALVSESEP